MLCLFYRSGFLSRKIATNGIVKTFNAAKQKKCFLKQFLAVFTYKMGYSRALQICIPIQITELAGYTARVADMFEVFEDMKRANYIRTTVNTKQSKPHQKIQTRVIAGQVRITEKEIELVDIPVVTPNGDIVVPSLSFKV